MKLTPIVNVCDSLVLICLMVSIPLQLLLTSIQNFERMS